MFPTWSVWPPTASPRIALRCLSAGGSPIVAADLVGQLRKFVRSQGALAFAEL